MGSTSTIDSRRRAPCSEDGRGVAAIVCDQYERSSAGPTADGHYLLESGPGEAVSAAASGTLQFRSKAPHSRRVCLSAGDYELTIYDIVGPNYKDKVPLEEGGRFGREESRRFPRFSLPFVLAPV